MTFPVRLLDGYAAFRDNRLARDRERYRVLAERGQRPQIMIVGCSDSRAAPETIFDAAPGELFVVRNVANQVPLHDPDGSYHGTSAAIEFAVSVLRVHHIVVMGHGRCGGIAAFLEGTPAGSHYLAPWVTLMAPAAKMVAEDTKTAAERQRALELASIRNAMANLHSFPFIAERIAEGTLAVHGAWFDISTGELSVLEGGDFISVLDGD